MNRVPYQPGKESELLIRSFFFTSLFFIPLGVLFQPNQSKEKGDEPSLPFSESDIIHTHALSFTSIASFYQMYHFLFHGYNNRSSRQRRDGRTDDTDRLRPFFLFLALTAGFLFHILQRPLDTLNQSNHLSIHKTNLNKTRQTRSREVNANWTALKKKPENLS